MNKETRLFIWNLFSLELDVVILILFINSLQSIESNWVKLFMEY